MSIKNRKSIRKQRIYKEQGGFYDTEGTYKERNDFL